MRDLCADLAAGDPHATPLEFTSAIAEDAQHRELAWLVTRAIWGDLRRDLGAEDVEHARELARSLTRRTIRAQNGFNLFLAVIARSSLRRPYLEELPNPWPWPAVKALLGTLRSALRRPAGRRRLGSRAATAAGATLLSLVLAGCAPSRASITPVPQACRRASCPPDSTSTRSSVSQWLRRTSAKPAKTPSCPRATSTRSGTAPTSRDRSRSACWPRGYAPMTLRLSGIDTGLSGPAFVRFRQSPYERVWVKDLIDQRIYLWFPPRANAVELVIVRNSFLADKQLILALVDLQLGKTPPPVPVEDAPPPPPQAPAPGVVG